MNPNLFLRYPNLYPYWPHLYYGNISVSNENSRVLSCELTGDGTHLLVLNERENKLSIDVYYYTQFFHIENKAALFNPVFHFKGKILPFLPYHYVSSTFNFSIAHPRDDYDVIWTKSIPSSFLSSYVKETKYAKFAGYEIEHQPMEEREEFKKLKISQNNFHFSFTTSKFVYFQSRFS